MSDGCQNYDRGQMPPRIRAQRRFAGARLLGEMWDDDEIHKAKHVLSAVYEGVDCLLTIEEMRALEKRGLVTDVNVKPGRGRYAGRYEFTWADKLEALVEASRTISPNVKVSDQTVENQKL